MKTILYLLLFGTGILFSQDMLIPDNPYNRAGNNISRSNSFNREKWFYEQRMYPYNYLPEDAYSGAFDQRSKMRRQLGFAFDNNVTWTSIGPTPGFHPIYSQVSGRVTTVKYDPVNPSVIYIGAAFGGVWKSTNSGLNWISLTDNEVSLSSGSIAIDPLNTGIIYYGTGEANYFTTSCYYGRGILKSTDGGVSWTNYTDGLPSLTYCSRIVIRPGNPSQVFAAMGTSGLYKSTNSGINWVQILSGRCDDIIFSPSGLNAYITGSGTGYRISTDGGVTFNSNSSLTMGIRNQIAICRSVPSVLYASVHSDSSIYVFKSTNSGLNFSQVAPGTNFNGSQAWYDFYIHVNPYDANYAYVGSIDLWRTSNGGISFENITNAYSGGVVHVDHHNMDFNPVNPDELTCVNDGGVWKSTNRGTNWINMNASLTLTQFYRIAADPQNANHVIGGTQDNGTQRTLGTLNWSAVITSDGGDVCFQLQNPQYILGETQFNGIRRSTNGGTTWQSAVSGLTGTGAWIAPLISHPTTQGVFYTARQQVFITTNWGVTWAPISSGTANTLHEMAISSSNPNIIYISSAINLYKSTNGGNTFISVASGLPNRVITSIGVHPDSSNVAVVSFSGFGTGKIFKTTNGASSWVNISGNLPDSPANDVLIYYPGTSTSILYAAMDIGVFFTDNYGITWSELTGGLPNTVAMHLDYNLATNKLRVGTHGRGVWETANPVGIINYNNEIPLNFNLSQNYPNPFNTVTNIKYQVLKNSFVKLAIYDIMGREIKVIVNRIQNAGSYIIQYDGSKQSSGTYFYRLSVSDVSASPRMSFTDTKKMILLK